MSVPSPTSNVAKSFSGDEILSIASTFGSRSAEITGRVSIDSPLSSACKLAERVRRCHKRSHRAREHEL
eukprot:6189236-Pleurochrysis_carterae.AAC.2